ncbi:maleylpyruvate isomerase N-terminal domain-containing protein, partial [Mycobacteroides chelonae]
MDTDVMWAHIDAGRSGVADMLSSLTPEQWSVPSLCDGWTVRDVAVHLTQAH